MKLGHYAVLVASLLVAVGPGLEAWLNDHGQSPWALSLQAVLAVVAARFGLAMVPPGRSDGDEKPRRGPPPGAIGGPPLGALGALLFAFVLPGCLPSVPVVTETPANQAQIDSCQSIAKVYNGLVLGDLVLLAGAPTIAGISAAVPTSSGGPKTDLAIASTVIAGAALVATGATAFVNQDFANGKCSSFVGALPAAPAAPGAAAALEPPPITIVSTTKPAGSP